MHLRNVAVGDQKASAKINSMFRVTFAEDKKILEAIQKQTDDKQKQNSVHVTIDKGSIAYRRKIKELIRSDQRHLFRPEQNISHPFYLSVKILITKLVLAIKKLRPAQCMKKLKVTA